MAVYFETKDDLRSTVNHILDLLNDREVSFCRIYKGGSEWYYRVYAERLSSDELLILTLTCNIRILDKSISTTLHTLRGILFHKLKRDKKCIS